MAVSYGSQTTGNLIGRRSIFTGFPEEWAEDVEPATEALGAVVIDGVAASQPLELHTVILNPQSNAFGRCRHQYACQIQDRIVLAFADLSPSQRLLFTDCFVDCFVAWFILVPRMAGLKLLHQAAEKGQAEEPTGEDRRTS